MAKLCSYFGLHFCSIYNRVICDNSRCVKYMYFSLFSTFWLIFKVLTLPYMKWTLIHPFTRFNHLGNVSVNHIKYEQMIESKQNKKF